METNGQCGANIETNEQCDADMELDGHCVQVAEDELEFSGPGVTDAPVGLSQKNIESSGLRDQPPQHEEELYVDSDFSSSAVIPSTSKQGRPQRKALRGGALRNAELKHQRDSLVSSVESITLKTLKRRNISKKQAIAVTPVTTKIEEMAVDSDASSNSSVKRGRGRPKKNSVVP